MNNSPPITGTKTLSSYIGQDKLKKLLLAEIKASKGQGMPMPHMLLSGNPGLGKSTLSRAIASELGYRITELSPDSLTRKEIQRTLIGLSTAGYARDGKPTRDAVVHLLFVDEAHKMPEYETWYEPLDDFRINIQAAISWLPYFTLIGATTEPEAFPAAFKRRVLEYVLEPYTERDLAEIVEQRMPGFKYSTEVVKRSRGSAALAIKYAERVRNFGGVGYFAAAEIDDEGLTRVDRAYIEMLRNNAGAMALSTISARLQMAPETVRKTVEPFLVSVGLVEITERGRVLCTPGRGARPAQNLTDAFLKIAEA